jgi:hypothetical protein
MAHAVRDQGVLATPVAYFTAAAAARASLARAGSEGTDRHVTGALPAFLSAATRRRLGGEGGSGMAPVVEAFGDGVPAEKMGWRGPARRRLR